MYKHSRGGSDINRYLLVRETPTICIHGPLASSNRNRCPMGSLFGQYFFASASLMTATFVDESVSLSRNPRPRSIGIFIASKKWLSTVCENTGILVMPFGNSYPSGTMDFWPTPPGDMGRPLVSAAVLTPGTCAVRSTTFL